MSFSLTVLGSPNMTDLCFDRIKYIFVCVVGGPKTEVTKTRQVPICPTGESKSILKMVSIQVFPLA